MHELKNWNVGGATIATSVKLTQLVVQLKLDGLGIVHLKMNGCTLDQLWKNRLKVVLFELEIPCAEKLRVVNIKGNRNRLLRPQRQNVRVIQIKTDQVQCELQVSGRNLDMTWMDGVKINQLKESRNKEKGVFKADRQNTNLT